MLIIYSLKETKVLKYPYGIPEVIGVVSVVILQKLFSNAFLSIIGSTVIYMILVQIIFKI
jgi:branched-subunit amino acid transport protein AzlD